jgi:hypothetical protein
MFVGALGRSGTSTLLGGSTYGTHPHSGGRLTFGYWLDDDGSIGLSFSGFGLASSCAHYFASSLGSPVLARPFFDTTGTSNALIVAGTQTSTGVLDSGWIDVRYRADLWGGEANLKALAVDYKRFQLEALAGFRTVGLNEALEINQNSSPTDPTFAGTTRLINDLFRSESRFYGGQIGASARATSGRWGFDLVTKLALGATQTYVTIDGYQNASIMRDGMLIASQSGISSGGLLTSPTNIGRYTRSRFSVVPEVGARLEYSLSPCCRLFAGYDLLYWTGVGRPGAQIDFVLSGRGRLNPNPTSDASHPQFNFSSGDVWVQGVNIGLEFRF